MRSKKIWMILLIVIFIILAAIRDKYIEPVQKLNYDAYMIGGVIDIDGIWRCIHTHAGEHNGNIPDGDKWCDQIMASSDHMLNSLTNLGTDCVPGESLYAFNKAASGMKLDELPDDLVLIFEVEAPENEGERNFPVEKRAFYADYEYKSNHTEMVYKDRWNISSGPERILLRPNLGSATIITAGNRPRRISYDKLHELRWDIEGTDYSEIFRQKLQVWSKNRDLVISHSRKVVIGGRIILAIAIIFILLYNRLSLLSIIPVLVFSAIAGFFGSVLGRGSEYLYNYTVHYSIGEDIGLYCGIAAAICYSAIMLNIKFKEKHFGEFLYSSVGYGVLTGILSSSVVHVSIALAGGYKFLPNLVIGGFFGAGAGLVLGIIFAIGLAMTKPAKAELAKKGGEK